MEGECEFERRGVGRGEVGFVVRIDEFMVFGTLSLSRSCEIERRKRDGRMRGMAIEGS